MLPESVEPIMKRGFDLVVCLIAMILLALPMLLFWLMVKMTSRGPAIYWSDRIGRNNVIFKMPKFRTMVLETPIVATHLLEHPERFSIPVGKFLRKFSLDELPQMFSILKGDMSLVGPRPALFNQDDLIAMRTERGIHKLVPGLTGWAQINGRDELPIPIKVGFDEYYLMHRSFLFDLKILLLTVAKVVRAEGVKGVK
jgi:O-antigen biosynthesis protein WbqP